MVIRLRCHLATDVAVIMLGVITAAPVITLRCHLRCARRYGCACHLATDVAVIMLGAISPRCHYAPLSFALRASLVISHPPSSRTGVTTADKLVRGIICLPLIYPEALEGLLTL